MGVLECQNKFLEGIFNMVIGCSSRSFVDKVIMVIRLRRQGPVEFVRK
jgi:hypothetical protein